MTLYVDVPPDQFKHGETYSLETSRGYERNKTHVFVIEEASFGDYMGQGLVGIANYKYFKDRFPNLVAFGQGTHGYEAVVIRADVPISEELQTILDGLNDYPILDEGYESEAEMEKETDAVIEEWRDISSEIVRPMLERYLERSSEEGDLNDDIFELDSIPPQLERWPDESKEEFEKRKANTVYKTEWHHIVDNVFAMMQHDSPGEWFDFDPHSGNATIKFQRIQEWLTRQPDAKIEEYLEPAIDALGPTGTLSPI
jgi:hypothetical protein